MARRRSTEGGRPNVVAVRLSDQEVADLDARRGSLTRSEWLRWLNTKARRDGMRFSGTPRNPLE